MRALLAPCSLILFAACAGPPPSAPVPVATASASATAVQAPSPRRTDPRWLYAASDDPLEKARLANAVGAAELLLGVEDGGATAEVALAALPFADDAEVALGRLGDLARASAGGRRAVLTAILGVAGQPRRQREAIDPEGARRCAEALVAIAMDAAVAREDRALAVSAARALAEKGYVDPARIPSDLDPPANKSR